MLKPAIGPTSNDSLVSARWESNVHRRRRPRRTSRPAAYAGLSVPVLGVGILLQHLSPRLTLLIFAAAVGLGILAAAPLLAGPFDTGPSGAVESGLET
jgi:nitroreductase